MSFDNPCDDTATIGKQKEDKIKTITADPWFVAKLDKWMTCDNKNAFLYEREGYTYTVTMYDYDIGVMKSQSRNF